MITKDTQPALLPVTVITIPLGVVVQSEPVVVQIQFPDVLSFPQVKRVAELLI